MDQQHNQLLHDSRDKLSKCKNKQHHIILQVHTHIQSLQATGTGVEVLEHWLQHKRLKYLDKVFYYEGKVYDFNDAKSERFSRQNRNNKWQKVSKFHNNMIR